MACQIICNKTLGQSHLCNQHIWQDKIEFYCIIQQSSSLQMDYESFHSCIVSPKPGTFTCSLIRFPMLLLLCFLYHFRSYLKLQLLILKVNYLHLFYHLDLIQFFILLFSRRDQHKNSKTFQVHISQLSFLHPFSGLYQILVLSQFSINLNKREP